MIQHLLNVTPYHIVKEAHLYKPDSREAAMLLLRAIQERGERRGKPLTRARLSRITLKRLWNRQQLTEPWLNEVNEWLLSAGWTLVFAGTTFGIVKTEVIGNWPRVAYKYLDPVIDQMKQGSFDFSRLEHLLRAEETPNKPMKRPRKITRRTPS